MRRDIGIGLSQEFLAELGTHLRFDTEADIAAFARDAMRVYADLGRLCQGKGRLLWHPEDGPPRPLRLPFEAAPSSQDST